MGKHVHAVPSEPNCHWKKNEVSRAFLIPNEILSHDARKPWEPGAIFERSTVFGFTLYLPDEGDLRVLSNYLQLLWKPNPKLVKYKKHKQFEKVDEKIKMCTFYYIVHNPKKWT